MKNIFSLLMVLTLVSSYAPSVFAADENAAPADKKEASGHKKGHKKCAKKCEKKCDEKSDKGDAAPAEAK